MARLIDAGSGECSPASGSLDGLSCELASGGSVLGSRGPGGSRVISHLTDSSCKVQVMAHDAVLGPGHYEL